MYSYIHVKGESLYLVCRRYTHTTKYSNSNDLGHICMHSKYSCDDAHCIICKRKVSLSGVETKQVHEPTHEMNKTKKEQQNV